MENKSINIKTMFVVAGAYASYTIGAGFASGNEVMQFFGSWGVPKAFLVILVGLICNAYFCASAYRAGQSQNFARSRDVYAYFSGKYMGWVFDIFCVIFVLLIFVTMFAGAGSMVNQVTGVPQWVGAVIIGVISAVVVFGGLKIVEQVLGYVGIVIIAYVVIFGLVSIFHPATSLDQAEIAVDAVADGRIWQANLLEMAPFSALGIAHLNNWLLDGLLYMGVCLIVCVPFIASLGKSTKNIGEATVSGIFSGIFFYAGAALATCILLMNFASVINPETNTMYPIPILAAVQSLFPGLTWSYFIILMAGIFTTITGYLWLLTDRVFGSEVNIKSRIFTAALMVAGILLGAVINFSAAVNFVWALSGFVGLIFLIFMIVKDIRTVAAKSGSEADAV